MSLNNLLMLSSRVNTNLATFKSCHLDLEPRNKKCKHWAKKTIKANYTHIQGTSKLCSRQAAHTVLPVTHEHLQFCVAQFHHWQTSAKKWWREQWRPHNFITATAHYRFFGKNGNLPGTRTQLHKFPCSIPLKTHTPKIKTQAPHNTAESKLFTSPCDKIAATGKERKER